jgi:peptidoglycan-N-acetylglucosamine deacetylase
MKVHGDEGWDKYPSYLDIVVPIFLDTFDKLKIKITFFVVGKDATIEKNKKILQSIIERGHEIGNHSFHHESWLKTYSKAKIEEEIAIAEDAIKTATGVTTNMFRGPGFSWSSDLLEVLQKRNYIFDASTLPTYISPLMRKYYFAKSNLSKKEKEDRKELFGSFTEGFLPLKPYSWQLKNNTKLLEIPVTTMPIFKLPFHQSYLLFISGYSKILMRLYLWFSIFMCRITKTSPSYLLHPLDLVGCDVVPQLSFFPGMQIASNKKMSVFVEALQQLQKHFEVMPMGKFYEQVKQTNKTINLK